MVSLYIENRYIELDKEVQFAITKTFEDISNPTSIINDWSKTVSIPFTDKNNETFGYIYNPDRITLHDEGLTTGLYFDPLKKLDFRLEWDSAVLMMGYAKMTSVTKTNGTGRYNLTLNGELGKVFQEMKKITFDESTEDVKYLIDGSKYVDETINKDLVYDLWSNGGGLDTTLYENTDEKYRISEIIGFAPNNSYNEGFDYKTYQLPSVNISEKFEEVLNTQATKVTGNDEATYQSYVGIAADTVIGEGLLPREIGEYRSYMQLPYIYFNKLFQIFTKKTEDITGYKVVLDNNWFNVANPYWSKLVYMLKSFNIKETDNNILQNITTTIPNIITSWYPETATDMTRNPGWTDIKNLYLYFNEDNSTTELDKYPLPNNKYSILKVDVNNICLILNFKGDVTGFNPNNPLNVKIVVTGNETLERYIKIVPTGTRLDADANTIILNFNEIQTQSVNDRQFTILPNIQAYFKINEETFGNEAKITLYFNWENESNPTVGGTIVGNGSTASSIPFDVSNAVGSVFVTSYNDVFRSDTKFTLNNLWNNEVNLFDEILNYCKQYRIGVFCDDINKTLTFKPLNIYFADYKVMDWTDKLDISKDYTIQPITFDNKYVLFNYEKNDVQLNKSYNESFGTNYGEYKVITDYEFNNNEKKLFNNVHNVITSTDPILNWEDLYTKTRVVYTLPSELYVFNKDKDKKGISVFGSMLFFNGIVKFDTEFDLRDVKISDDTKFQTFTQTYFYTQKGEEGCYVSCDRYPLLDIVYDANLCLFNTPMENYTYIPNHYDDTKGIYTNFWKKYLDERYNTNNKLVTCYLHISPTDYMNFEFNKFIKIENQLYMVNKIYDYDITSNSSTKVDLVTIQDIEGYTTNNFDLKYFVVYNVFGEIWDNELDYISLDSSVNKRTIHISSNSDVTISIKNVESGDIDDLTINGVDALDIYNGYYSTINAGFKVPVDFSVIAGSSDFRCTITLTNKEGKSIDIAVVNIQ